MSRRRPPAVQLRRLPLDRLCPRPDGGEPARVEPRVFRALCRHLKAGPCPPLIVRPRGDAAYEILDGRLRAACLRRLGRTHARCEVWRIGDDRAELAAATLNDLRHRRDRRAHAERVRKIVRRLGAVDARELLALTPRGLRQMMRSLEPPMRKLQRRMELQPVVFHLPRAEASRLMQRLRRLAPHARKRGAALLEAMDIADGRATEERV